MEWTCERAELGSHQRQVSYDLPKWCFFLAIQQYICSFLLVINIFPIVILNICTLTSLINSFNNFLGLKILAQHCIFIEATFLRETFFMMNYVHYGTIKIYISYIESFFKFIHLQSAAPEGGAQYWDVPWMRCQFIEGRSESYSEYEAAGLTSEPLCCPIILK